MSSEPAEVAVGEDGAELGDFLPDQGAIDPAAAEAQDFVDRVRASLNHLSERHRDVLVMRYRLDDGIR